MANDTPTPADMPQNSDAPDDTPDSPRFPSSVDELPDWAQQELKRARTDAKKYRERATAAERSQTEQQTEAQRIAEERDQLSQRATDAEQSLAKFRAALRAGFSGDEAEDIASRLRGSTEDDWHEDAKALRERFPAPSRNTGVAPDPSQGSGEPALNGDPLAELLRNKLK